MYSQLLVLWWGQTSKTLVIGGNACGDIAKDSNNGQASSVLKSGETGKSGSGSQLLKSGNQCNQISKEGRGGMIRSPKGGVGINRSSRGGTISGNNCKR